ncbi:hypothetical protein G9A89_000951, partial [Geosiphon pyriformis]
MNFENQPYQRSNSIGQPICHDNRHSYQQQLYQNQFVRNECHVEPSQITFFNKQNQNFAHDNVNDANSSLNQTKDYVNAFTLTHPGSSEIRQLSNSQSEMPPSFNSGLEIMNNSIQKEQNRSIMPIQLQYTRKNSGLNFLPADKQIDFTQNYSFQLNQSLISQQNPPPIFGSTPFEFRAGISSVKTLSFRRKTAGFRTYAMKTLHGLLPVAERKKVYSSE